MIYFIFVALLTPFFDALGNIVDGRLSRAMNLHSNIFYRWVISLLVVPLVLVFWLPSFPTAWAWPVILLWGFVHVLYLYPYTLALQSIDTSIVTALFSLGKSMIPVLAFCMVGEKLTPEVYVGFLMIMSASVFLSLVEVEGAFRINKAFFYMLACSFILAFNAVAEKFILNTQTDWITLFFWSQVVSIVVTGMLLVFPKYRKDVRVGYADFRDNLLSLVLQSALELAGAAAFIFAIYISPVTFVSWVEALQPLMVLGFSYCIHQVYPAFVFEAFHKEKIRQKLFWFLCLLVWVSFLTHGFTR